MNGDKDLLNKVYSYVTLSKFKKAYAAIIKLFLKQPSQKAYLEELFIFIINKYADELEENQKYQEVFACYEKGLVYYPNNCDILNDTGVRLQRYGRTIEASICFEKVLSNNVKFLKSYQNLQNTKCELIERWHFRMLNDDVRNSAYRNAINNKIECGYCEVLDIGTGTGLLSLYALNNSKLKSITACDGAEIMAKIANDVFRSNHFAGKITLIPKYSHELPGGRRYSLIVTEILDSGVFGEGILETLIDAKEKLLNLNGQIIPNQVSLHISGFKSRTLASSNILLNDEFCRKFNLPLNCLISREGVKCYDAEDVYRIRGNDDFEIITDSKIGLNVNFNDLDDMKRRYNGEASDETELICLKDDILDGFVVWFDLELDSENTISTNPALNTCWNQAIFKLNNRVRVTENQALKLSLSCKDGSLEIIHALNVNEEQMCVDESVLMFLNDVDYVKALENDIKHIPAIGHILDFSIFPIVGLSLLKEKKAKTLFCPKMVDNLVKLIAKQNKIPDSSICYLNIPSEMFAKDNIMLDLIVIQPFDIFGQLNSEQFCQLQSLKTKLKPNALVIPNQIELHGIVVESDWLINSSRVSNKDIIRFHIDKFLENFSTENHLDLGYFALENLSDSEKLCDISIDGLLHESSKTINLKIKSKASDINAILYFYRVQFLDKRPFISTNRPQSHIKRSAFITPKLDTFENDDIESVNIGVVQNHGIIKCNLTIN